MRAKHVVIIAIVLAALAAVVILRRGAVQPTLTATDSVSVVATFYPLAEFARLVGGDRVAVATVVPAGVEPHEFEPTPQVIAHIAAADIFIVNGGGIDAWASALAPSLQERGVRVLIMAPLMDADALPATGDDSAVDGHFWLSPVLAQRLVDAIRDALIAGDPAHADEYRSRTNAYRSELAALDRAYVDGLQSCAIRTAVTSHAAFAYLARAYSFEQLAIAGLSPDAEPSAGALAEIATVAQSRGVRYIFFETLASPKIAEALARAIGAKTLVFNPLEGLTDAEISRGASYLSVMRENLASLRTAMACR